MKQNHNKKALALLVSLIVLVAVSVGGTLAYLFTATDPIENTFTPARVSCDVVESFENNIKENVRIQNTGNTDAYIRAAIVVTWKNNAGEVYAVAPVEGVDYTIDLGTNTNDGWNEGNDKFYYFTQAVAPVTECGHATNESCQNCCTGVLINRCIQAEGATVPNGYYLSVEIVASAIQSAPDSVVTDKWSNAKVSVTGMDGTLTIKNEQGG